MNDIVNLISVIIVSAGGTGAIILGLSNWIGKIWMNKFAEKHRVKYERELEVYRTELNARLNKFDKLQEKALYISKVNYDNEYKIYMEIWQKLINCISDTNFLYPRGLVNVPIDKDEYEKYQEDKYKKYSDSYNDYSNCIEKYAPFYKKKFYDQFIIIRNECHFIGAQFFMYEFEVKYSESFRSERDLKISTKELKEIYEKEKKIDLIKEKLLSDIRKYLDSLVINKKN